MRRPAPRVAPRAGPRRRGVGEGGRLGGSASSRWLRPTPIGVSTEPPSRIRTASGSSWCQSAGSD